MASTSDVCDILDLKGDEGKAITKAAIINAGQKKKPKPKEIFKRPEGMHRELYALLYHDNMDKPPLLPTDSIPTYQTAKAKLSCIVVRPWKWMPFTNPARSDGAVFHHWRRAEDQGKDYQFAKFNKNVQVPVYSEQEYHQFLSREDWTQDETGHLFDLCKRFDLRWHVIFDRFDHRRFSHEKQRSLEDMKERYYGICNTLGKLRKQPGEDFDEICYDADHERRRRQQLRKLYARTEEQVEEEAMLVEELKRIEARKRERDKKSQDLQKLIAFDSGNEGFRRAERKSSKKKSFGGFKRDGHNEDKVSELTYGIKFPDGKSSGVTLRSQMMKLPTSLGQKKTKSLEVLLNELKIEQHPMPTENVVQMYNRLRSDMVHLYDLKVAYANNEMELQTLRYKWDAIAPGHMVPIESLNTVTIKKDIFSVFTKKPDGQSDIDSAAKTDSASDQLIDVGCPSPPVKKSSVG